MGNGIMISVIIPTYNRRERLKRCIESLLSQDYPRDNYEVIITDDGSTDGTKEMMNGLAPQKRLIYLHHDNVGRAANRNIGIRKSRGELLLFIDDDVIAENNLLSEHHKMHCQNKDPKLVLLGYTPFTEKGQRNIINRYYEAFWKRVYKRAEENTMPEIYGLFITNNLSVKRAFINEGGLFDENFKNYSFEDSELGYRLFKNGMRLMFNKKACASHNYDIGFNQSLKQQYHTGISAVVFYKKHPELKEVLSIDSAMGNFDKPIGYLRRMARTIKPFVYNDLSALMASLFVMGFNELLPDAASFKIIGFIHWHNYMKGIKTAMRTDDK